MPSATSSVPNGRIVVLRRDGTDSASFELSDPSYLFGRGAHCDIRIQLACIADEQCRLHQDQDGRVVIEGLFSTGTLVDGELVGTGETLEMKPGSILTIVERSFRYDNTLLPNHHRDNTLEQIPKDCAPSTPLKDQKSLEDFSKNATPLKLMLDQFLPETAKKTPSRLVVESPKKNLTVDSSQTPTKTSEGQEYYQNSVSKGISPSVCSPIKSQIETKILTSLDSSLMLPQAMPRTPTAGHSKLLNSPITGITSSPSMGIFDRFSSKSPSISVAIIVDNEITASPKIARSKTFLLKEEQSENFIIPEECQQHMDGLELALKFKNDIVMEDAPKLQDFNDEITKSSSVDLIQIDDFTNNCSIRMLDDIEIDMSTRTDTRIHCDHQITDAEVNPQTAVEKIFDVHNDIAALESQSKNIFEISGKPTFDEPSISEPQVDVVTKVEIKTTCDEDSKRNVISCILSDTSLEVASNPNDDCSIKTDESSKSKNHPSSPDYVDCDKTKTNFNHNPTDNQHVVHSNETVADTKTDMGATLQNDEKANSDRGLCSSSNASKAEYPARYDYDEQVDTHDLIPQANDGMPKAHDNGIAFEPNLATCTNLISSKNCRVVDNQNNMDLEEVPRKEGISIYEIDPFLNNVKNQDYSSPGIHYVTEITHQFLETFNGSLDAKSENNENRVEQKSGDLDFLLHDTNADEDDAFIKPCFTEEKYKYTENDNDSSKPQDLDEIGDLMPQPNTLSENNMSNVATDEQLGESIQSISNPDTVIIDSSVTVLYAIDESSFQGKKEDSSAENISINEDCLKSTLGKTDPHILSVDSTNPSTPRRSARIQNAQKKTPAKQLTNSAKKEDFTARKSTTKSVSRQTRPLKDVALESSTGTEDSSIKKSKRVTPATTKAGSRKTHVSSKQRKVPASMNVPQSKMYKALF